MDISRTKRVLGCIINGITFQGLLIGNLLLLLTAGKTVGGLVAGYKYEKPGIGILFLWLTKMLEGLLVFVTFSVFFWVDIFTMGNRNGTFAEAWADNRKVSL